MNNGNKMRELCIEKVTLNIGVGKAGELLENAKTLLERLSGCKAVSTRARTRLPAFKIQKGEPIGAKATLRGAVAVEDFLKKAFEAKNKRVSATSIDRDGNFSFGIAEYIELPGAKYDPKIGIIGFDVSVTMRRRGGLRISKRKRGRTKIPSCQRISSEETSKYISERFGVLVE